MSNTPQLPSSSLHPLVLPRPRSPLDAMIDKATGYKPEPPSKDKIRLYCPKCKRWQYADKDDTDPPNVAIIDVTCPNCNHGDHELVDYFDEAGRQIDLDGNLMERENDKLRDAAT